MFLQAPSQAPPTRFSCSPALCGTSPTPQSFDIADWKFPFKMSFFFFFFLTVRKGFFTKMASFFFFPQWKIVSKLNIFFWFEINQLNYCWENQIEMLFWANFTLICFSTQEICLRCLQLLSSVIPWGLHCTYHPCSTEQKVPRPYGRWNFTVLQRKNFMATIVSISFRLSTSWNNWLYACIALKVIRVQPMASHGPEQLNI